MLIKGSAFLLYYVDVIVVVYLPEFWMSPFWNLFLFALSPPNSVFFGHNIATVRRERRITSTCTIAIHPYRLQGIMSHDVIPLWIKLYGLFIHLLKRRKLFLFSKKKFIATNYKLPSNFVYGAYIWRYRIRIECKRKGNGMNNFAPSLKKICQSGDLYFEIGCFISLIAMQLPTKCISCNNSYMCNHYFA